MAGNRNPRKARKPRDVQADPISWAIAGAHNLPHAAVANLFVPIDAAVLLLKQGRATRDDWNVLAQALNVGEAFAAARIGDNLLPDLLAGQAALRAIALRLLETGRSTCYAEELAAVDEALLMFRVQVRVCTQAELSRALNRVRDLHRSGAMDDIAQIYNGMAGPPAGVRLPT